MTMYKSSDKGHHDFENEKTIKEVFCPECGKGNPYTSASNSVCSVIKGKRICRKTYHCSNCKNSWEVED